MSYTQTYSNLYVTSLDQHFHEQTSGYWFTVTNAATAHTAFRTRAGLDRWLNERGLSLESELPEAGSIGTSKVIGEYRTKSHGVFSDEPYSPDYPDGPRKMIEDDFYDLTPVAVTAEMSNGRYTLALITEEDGVRTIHTLNPNVKTRIEFSYEKMREAL